MCIFEVIITYYGYRLLVKHVEKTRSLKSLQDYGEEDRGRVQAEISVQTRETGEEDFVCDTTAETALLSKKMINGNQWTTNKPLSLTM